MPSATAPASSTNPDLWQTANLDARNGEEVVIVEVKTILSLDDKKHFIRKLEQARTWSCQVAVDFP